MDSNNDILALYTFEPPTGYTSLSGNGWGGFGQFLQQWANSDTSQVLGDIQSVANDPTSTKDVANLLSDSQKADADATAINAAAKTAAVQAGIKHFSGLGLPVWGLQQK
jgi:hypothetical protein